MSSTHECALKMCKASRDRGAKWHSHEEACACAASTSRSTSALSSIPAESLRLRVTFDSNGSPVTGGADAYLLSTTGSPRLHTTIPSPAVTFDQRNYLSAPNFSWTQQATVVSTFFTISDPSYQIHWWLSSLMINTGPDSGQPLSRFRDRSIPAVKWAPR